MAIKAKIIGDSLNSSGCRLTTFELRYHRYIHSEVMTHRVFSRNAASSRAIPIEKMIEQVEEDPAIPVHWGKAQKGMGAEEELTPQEQEEALFEWLRARDSAVVHAKKMLKLGLAKQVVNRILEPWVWMCTIVGSTEWDNFFHLRAEAAAMPEFQQLAFLMLDAMNASTPKALTVGEWHLPYADEIGGNFNALSIIEKVKVCTALCGRISYLNHGKDYPLENSIQWAEERTNMAHWSVSEFTAEAMGDACFYGNYRGFSQYRYRFGNQNITNDPRLKKYTVEDFHKLLQKR